MCSDCSGSYEGDQNVNTGDGLDLETDVKPAPIPLIPTEKYCAGCSQARPARDSFCWLCGAELIREVPNTCTRDDSHKVDAPDHFCVTCGAQTIYGVKKDGMKAMFDAEPTENPADDLDFPF